MWKQSLLLLSSLSTLINGFDCNAHGPIPIGYCSAGLNVGFDSFEINCIESITSNGTESIEFTVYYGAYCDNGIRWQSHKNCIDFADECMRCCGQDKCTEDQVMRIEGGECAEEFEEYFVNDACISDEYRHIGNVSYIHSNLSVLIEDKFNSSIEGIKLYCDSNKQHITYDAWNNENCEGLPVASQPELIYNVSADPCSKLYCSATDEDDLDDEDDINSTIQSSDYPFATTNLMDEFEDDHDIFSTLFTSTISGDDLEDEPEDDPLS